MIERLVAYGRWILYVLVGIPILLIGIPLACLSRSRALRLLRLWNRIGLKIFRVKYSVVDRNQGQYQNSKTLYITLNQTSLIEELIGTIAIETDYRLVINIELALVPIIGWYCAVIGSTILIRQWKEQSKRALERAIIRLRENSNYWISIEGRRNPHGQLGEFKKGPVIMAIKAGAEIVPIVYRGMEKVSPTGLLFVKPGHVEVEFCEKISAREYTLEQRELLVERLRAVALAKLS